MARGSPMSISFTSFRGATRRLVLWNVVVFFVLSAAGWIVPRLTQTVILHSVLQPVAVMHGEIWQLATYSFVNVGLLGVLFSMMTLWFSGNMLESAFSGRWVMELYFTSVIGGGLVAALLSYVHLPNVGPLEMASGAWGGVFGLMVGIAVFFGEQEFLFMFVLRMRAKHMVMLYILIELAMLLTHAQAFDALVQLAGAGCGYLYVKRAPRRGLAGGFSEGYFGLRNNYYRWKRRRAAKKFTVYMRKQNRDVNFDESGHYVEPDDTRRDPNDKRWMN